MNESNVQDWSFTGWVYDVKNGKYGIDIKVRAVKDESSVKWCQKVMFTISEKAKKFQEIEAVGIGKMDKVTICGIPNLVEGVSKSTNKAYAMMKVNITSAKILEKATADDLASEEGDPDDMPF